jgi:phosphoribosylglycinamide formyltransferase-1
LKTRGTSPVKVKVGVLASGRGSNLLAILDAIGRGELPATVVCAISDRRSAPVLERAGEVGVPAFCVPVARFADRAAHETEIARILDSHEAELIVLAGYMRLLTGGFIERYRGRLMNIHPALLPGFTGAEAQRQAWEHGVKVAGCTVHFVDEGADTGPIITQRAVPVLEHDTPETLAERILAEEHQAYPEAIRLYAEGRLVIEGRRVRILGRP